MAYKRTSDGLTCRAYPDLPCSIILVPGRHAETLVQQTCEHFPAFLERCYTNPHTAVTVWVYDLGLNPRSDECWDIFYAAGEDLLQQAIAVVKDRPDVSDPAAFLHM